jgi:replicative DNA helicase
LPIFVNDNENFELSQITNIANAMIVRHNCDVLYIDYLQLMGSAGVENRVQEISEISRALKGVARELNVPVLALSQLNRALEARPDKKPLLSDLRESGSIEQDADVVMFVYREEYYNRDTDKKNIAEIIVRKHRNGPTGEVPLYFISEQMRFVNLEKKHNDFK